MANRPFRAPPSSSSPLFARIGQEFVWVIVALLFCVVEAAVKLTEFQPRLSTRRTGGAHPTPRAGRGAMAG